MNLKRTLGIKRTLGEERSAEFLSCLGNGKSIIEIEQEEEDSPINHYANIKSQEKLNTLKSDNTKPKGLNTNNNTYN